MEVFENMSFRKKMTMGLVAVLLFFCLIFIGCIIENVAADRVVINQVPISGTLNFWVTQGWHLQKFGDVTTYDKAFNIWFSTKQDQGESQDESIRIIFNDAGGARISGSARLVLPLDRTNLMAIHTEFHSMKVLVHELIKPTITKVVFATGPLMSSFESYAVKKNDLIRYIEDQLRWGIYKTVSQEVSKIDELSGKRKTVTLAKLIPNAEAPGGYERQEDAPFRKYGIDIRAVAVEEIVYDDTIMQQIASQQKALMDVQTSIAEAKKAKQRAIKAEEQGKANYQTAKWEQETINAKEIAEAEKAKKVAKLDMEKAFFQKKADILAGEGIATKKRLVMQADGALKQKLEAWTKVQGFYADALAKYQGNLVPQIVLGGNTKGGSTDSVKNLMDLIMIKTAKDLRVEVTPNQ